MNYASYDDLFKIFQGIKGKISGGGGSSTSAAAAPGFYERESLPTPNKTELVINKTWTNINDTGYTLDTVLTVDLDTASSWDDSQYSSASNRAGSDFYIYAVEPSSGTTPDIILSHNSTVPTGYTQANSRKIGGFHCLCKDVGTILGHTLSGYKAGEILPLSVWDLKHRAISDNEGMVWVPAVNMWVDIYLGSWDGTKIVSEYGGVPITGISSKPMHGHMMAEEYGKVNKILPRFDDFMVYAKGNPENDFGGSTAPTQTGGHTDTGGQRLISNYGLEDCTGVLWQWGSECPENWFNTGGNATTYRGSYYNAGETYLRGYGSDQNSIYNSAIDASKMGTSYGLMRRLLFGGSFDSGAASGGSRSVAANGFGSNVDSNCGGRGLSAKR